MKNCKKCGTLTDDFHKSKIHKDGLLSWCKSCQKKLTKKYRKTKLGVVTNIYSTQVRASKHRKHPLPMYDLKELQDWCLKQDIFHTLYDNWKKSGFEKKLIPSIDRLDDYKGYSFDNIQIMTWEENYRKFYKDKLTGINNKINKSIVQYNLNNKKIKKFYSIAQAERETKNSRGNIWACCNGRRKTAGGYIWKYNN